MAAVRGDSGTDAAGIEDFPEGGEGFDGQRFSAGLRVDGSLRQRGRRIRGRKSRGAQIVGKRLALLREGLAQEALEAAFIDAQFLEARSKPPAKDRGVHIGRRRKCFGRQRKERLGGPVHLESNGEQTVVARAWMGGDAVGNFALNHEDGEVERGVAGRQLEQDRRGDVVGQIADHAEPLARRSGNLIEIEVEYVLFKDRDFVGRKLRAQLCGEVMIQFDSNHAACFCGQGSGDGASAGANFDDGAAGEIAECGDNTLTGVRVVEEVLSEFGLGGHVLS